MSWLPLFFLALLVTNLVFLIVALVTAERLVTHHHAQRVDFFRHHPVQAGDIVFLGDSLTAGGNWHEIFPGLPVKNRGINADTTVKVLERLDDVLTGQPKAIFLLIGTNDLPWYMFRSDAAILDSYRAILDRCCSKSPQTKLFIQSIFPRLPLYTRRIQRLNGALNALTECDNHRFINVFPQLADMRGGLRHELTNDNLHLMAAGYAIWSEALMEFVKPFESN